MNAFSWYWLAWVFFGFLAPEAYTLTLGNKSDSLSANVWRLESVVPGQWVPVWSWTFLHVICAGILGTLFAWTLIHLVFGIWR